MATLCFVKSQAIGEFPCVHNVHKYYRCLTDKLKELVINVEH